MSIQVVVRPETFELSAQRSVVGVIFVRVGNRSFPDDSWSDFPLVILSWWIEKLADAEPGRVAALRFMEGPYYVEVRRRISIESAVLRLVDEQSQDLTRFPIQYADFRAEVVKASVIAASECDRRHWETCDLKELQRALTRFEGS